MNPCDGFLLVDKPAGISSFGLVEQIKRASGKRFQKIGHFGTLDPFATGLMIIGTGNALKLAQFFIKAPKSYEGTIRFGETTIPGDPTDPISEKCNCIPESLAGLEAIAREMTLKPYWQIPPMHSAKKKDGVPLYELARRGLTVERAPVELSLHDFHISEYEPPLARFNVRCSSGTYIRTLAQDFAKLAGTLGYLLNLRRTSVGRFTLEQAVTLQACLDDLTRATEDISSFNYFIPFEKVFRSSEESLEVDSLEASALVHGRKGIIDSILQSRGSVPLAASNSGILAFFYKSRLLAIGRKYDHAWKLERVFPHR